MEQEREALVAAKQAKRIQRLNGRSRLEKLKLTPGQDPQAVAAELRQDPRVEMAEPNYLINRDEIVPNDPQFNDQWALRNTGQNGGQITADIGAAMGWETTTGSTSTVIAVIDSGIDFTHPDLQNNQWTNTVEQANGVDDDHNGLIDDLQGWDWVANSNEIKDEQGHGTSIAGLIAAEGNNGVGMTGVMWRASLMSLRVLDSTGTGTTADAVEAIDYAVAHGAKVINCSWGTDAESLILRDAIQRAATQEVLVVASAGNGARDIDVAPYYPASFDLPNVVAVAATNNLNQLASSSNWGEAGVALAAPGVDILTTQMGGGYGQISGTSASTALVTGVAGLIKTLRPLLGAADTKAALVNGSRQVADLAGKVFSAGVLSASGGVTAIQGPDVQPSPSPTATPSPTPEPTPVDGGGSGDDGDGSASTDPPGTPGPPRANLPGLEKARSIENVDPRAPEPIHSDAMCLTCDAGGAEPPSSMASTSNPDPDFSTARTQPLNRRGQQGVDLGSQNYNWSLPLVSLPGRSGLGLNLTLTYNSLVWVKDGTTMRFNADRGFPGPGFHLGMPTIQQRYRNPLIGTGVYAYLMVMPSGGAVELRQVGATNVYESDDDDYIQMIDNGASGAVVRTMDGTEMTFAPSINNEMRCTRIMDRNGNYISASYQATTGRLNSVTDTLGRTITFAYNPTTGNLGSIRQQRTTDAGVTQTFTWATFTYDALTVQPDFGTLAVQGPQSSTINVPVQVGVADGSYYKFEYTKFGQVWRISHYAPDDGLLSYTSYNLADSPLNPSTSQTDCPRFTEQHDWARDWNGDTNGVGTSTEEAVTTYTVASDNSYTKVTMPDSTEYKQLFYVTGWQKGLIKGEEYWSEGVKKKWTSTVWTQDDDTLAYKLNPRMLDVRVYDDSQNVRRTAFTYHPAAMYNLVKDVKEYAAGGASVLRSLHYEYNLASGLTNKRIIGLVSEKTVYKGDIALSTAVLESKVTYQYDEGSGLLVLQGKPVQHDIAYDTINTTTMPRGNITSVQYWDATDATTATDATKMVESNIAYNTAGSIIFTRDPLQHKVSASYTDAYYSDATSHNTWAYPTSVTDADGYTSSTEYDFDTGQSRKTHSPSKGTGTSITYVNQLIDYDSAGRIIKATNLTNNNSYTKWVYPTTNLLVQQYQTIESGLGLAYSWQVLDGAGRVTDTASDLPPMPGQTFAENHYTGQSFVYDVMGRTIKRSNPTEMIGTWLPTGDDSAGWRWTQQQYDWKGRPTVTTNQDNTTRSVGYDGCGCAGGEQTTVTDERGRSRRLTADILGRLSKVEELNFDGTIYATTSYTYDVLNNLLTINQGGRNRTFVYDGYGRLQSRTTPEQGTTNYTYNTDGTLNVVTDARGATTTLSYNKRHLVTGITYGGTGTAPTPNVTVAYDAAGHRTSMTEAQFGKVDYVYNDLGQLTSETRTFSDTATPPAPVTLTYAYNWGGELETVTSSLGPVVGYTHDKTGRVTKVTGSGYGGVTSYVDALGYRAFGGLKAMTYGNTKALSVTYDTRMRTKQWNVAGVLGWNYSYTQTNTNLQENTGRVTFADSLNDAKLDRSYEYDQVGRLVESHTGSEARAHVNGTTTTVQDGPYSGIYIYDPWGNIKERQGWGVENSQYVATLNTKNQLVKNPATGATMTYDAAGNLTNDGTQTLTYDVPGRQVTASSTNMTQSYDGDGLRVKKVENGITTYYVRSSLLGSQVVAELNPQGQMQRGYVYLGAQLLAVQENNTVTWVHQDPITKSQRFTDGAGGLLGYKIDLDPWGGETNRTIDPTTSPQPPTHRFTTYERDQNKTDDAMFRRHNSGRNRFDQPDPYEGSYRLTNPQSFNRYSYTQNDPVNFIDPSGLKWSFTQTCVSIDGVRNCSDEAHWEPDPPEVLDGPNEFGGGGVGGDPGTPDPTQQQPPVQNINFQEIRFSFYTFLTTQISQNCRNALAGFMTDLTRLANSAALYDVDQLGDQPALGYFGYGDRRPLGQAFDATRANMGADILSVNEPAGVNTNRHGIYFRSGERPFQRPTGMYLLLHEMMHLLVAPTANPRQSGDQVLGQMLGLALRGGENWSHAVSRYFSSECNPRELGP